MRALSQPLLSRRVRSVAAKAGDVREGVFGRRATADRVMDLVAGGQRLRRLVEQRMESASSSRVMTVPSC